MNTARKRYRPDADALGEAVVSLDVLVQLTDGSGSQCRAVVGLVDVQHRCKMNELFGSNCTVCCVRTDVGSHCLKKFPPFLLSGKVILIILGDTHRAKVTWLALAAAALTVGEGQQGAVRCVHVARSHVVPLRRPVDGAVVLRVKLLHRQTDRQSWPRIDCSLAKN